MDVRHLGTIEYREALALQIDLRSRVQGGELDGALLLLEHPAVYTLGRRSAPGELPMGEDWYRAQGIDIVRTDRGGKLTYHGPGQLVGYPIVRVTRIPDHIGAMERAIVQALAAEHVEARGRDAEGAQWTGVWVGERKIASIGVHVSRGVAMHVACGLPDTQMTSVCRETGRTGTLPALRDRVAAALLAELRGVPSRT